MYLKKGIGKRHLDFAEEYGRKWFYYDSPVMAISEEEAQEYDNTLEKMEKKYQPSQEEFYIMSHAFIE